MTDHQQDRTITAGRTIGCSMSTPPRAFAFPFRLADEIEGRMLDLDAALSQVERRSGTSDGGEIPLMDVFLDVDDPPSGS